MRCGAHKTRFVQGPILTEYGVRYEHDAHADKCKQQKNARPKAAEQGGASNGPTFLG